MPWLSTVDGPVHCTLARGAAWIRPCAAFPEIHNGSLLRALSSFPSSPTRLHRSASACRSQPLDPQSLRLTLGRSLHSHRCWLHQFVGWSDWRIIVVFCPQKNQCIASNTHSAINHLFPNQKNRLGHPKRYWCFLREMVYFQAQIIQEMLSRLYKLHSSAVQVTLP